MRNGWRKLFLDAGAMIGKEKGSGDELKAWKIAVSVGYKNSK